MNMPIAHVDSNKYMFFCTQAWTWEKCEVHLILIQESEDFLLGKNSHIFTALFLEVVVGAGGGGA